MLYTTVWTALLASFGCFIRISKILLYAIHNLLEHRTDGTELFYQDFKDTFVCYTQLNIWINA